ncbi:hypothetical protein RJ498_000583 [Pluralibacter gergoviae]
MADSHHAFALATPAEHYAQDLARHIAAQQVTLPDGTLMMGCTRVMGNGAAAVQPRLWVA